MWLTLPDSLSTNASLQPMTLTFYIRTVPNNWAMSPVSDSPAQIYWRQLVIRLRNFLKLIYEQLAVPLPN